MKRSRYLGWILACALPAAAGLRAQDAPAPDPRASLERAHVAVEAGRYAEALTNYQAYFTARPEDVAGAVEFAGLLSRARPPAEAAALLETVRERHPQHEVAAFQLGALYMQLGRNDEGRALFAALSQSSNAALAEAANESLRTMRSEADRAERLQAEAEIFDRARSNRHAEVVAAVNAHEARWGLSYTLAMQRLYAWYDLGEFQTGWLHAEPLAGRFPAAHDLAFLQAEFLMKLNRRDEAAAIWRRIQDLNPGSLESLEAQRRLDAGTAPASKAPSPEDRFFSLAREAKHAEVVKAIDDLEQQAGGLSHMLEMQRLYSLQALGQVERAAVLAERLSERAPQPSDLAFVRAEIKVKQGRPDEAVAIWEALKRERPGTPEAAEAERRMAVFRQAPRSPGDPPPGPEARIYELAGQGRHAEAVAAIDALEAEEGSLSWPLRLQRLYAVAALGDAARADALSAAMMAERPGMAEAALVRADALWQLGRWEEASVLWHEVAEAHPSEATGESARARLANVPPRYDPRKDYWGEAYFAGVYLGRYGDLVGYGLARHGTFVPNARWLQPYVEFRFSVDTDSSRGRRATIVTDNFVGFYGGMRAQLLPREYLYAYGQAGTEEDLLDGRNDGDWGYDYQAGIYGYKSWGPGLAFHSSAEHDQRFSMVSAGERSVTRLDVVSTNGWVWRNDWFADVGADFSYYHRYGGWLGYGLVREGLRLFQIGPTLAFDTYLAQHLAWDVRGNYFDNFVSVGPGVRWVWRPCLAAEVVLFSEYLNGFYFGRDGEDNRGGASGQYDEVQVGLSVGMRW